MNKKEDLQAFLDELLQQTMSSNEIDNIRRKLALLTTINKRICVGLGFSKAAQVTNAIFPDEALKWAANNCKRYLEGDERYFYFHKLCHMYCIEHQIPIDPTLQNKLYSLFQVSSDSPKTTITRIHAPLNKIKRRPTHYKPPGEGPNQKKGMVYDNVVRKRQTSKTSVLTSDDIHMLKYGTKKKRSKSNGYQTAPKSNICPSWKPNTPRKSRHPWKTILR